MFILAKEAREWTLFIFFNNILKATSQQGGLLGMDRVNIMKFVQVLWDVSA